MKQKIFYRLHISAFLLIFGTLVNFGQLNEVVDPFGHKVEIETIAFSNDGKTLASGDFIGFITFWDVELGAEKGDIKAHNGQVNSIVFTPDGKYLISAGEDELIKIWDAATMREIKTLRGHTLNVNTLTLHPNGKILLSGSSDTTIRAWDLETGTEIKTLDKYGGEQKYLTFSPDGQQFAALEGNSIRVWNTQTALFDVPAAAKTLISDVEKGSTADKAGLKRGDIVLDVNGIAEDIKYPVGILNFRVRRGSEILKITIDKKADSKIGIDREELKPGVVLVLYGHEKDINSIAFSPDGKKIVSGSKDETVRVWDLEIGKQIWSAEMKDEVTNVSFNPEGKMIAAGLEYDLVILLNAATGKEVFPLLGDELDADTLVFNKKGNLLATAGKYHTIKLWDIESGRNLKTLEGKLATVNGISLSPNGQLMAVSKDDRFLIFDVATKNPTAYKRQVQRSSTLENLTFSNSNQFFLTSSTYFYGNINRVSELWNVNSGEFIRFDQSGCKYRVSEELGVFVQSAESESIIFNHFTSEVFLLNGSCLRKFDYTQKTSKELIQEDFNISNYGETAISSDGKYLAVGGSKIELLRVEGEKLYGEHIFEKEAAQNLKFSPDNRLLASFHKGGTIKIWSVQEKRLLKSFETNSITTDVFMFAPDGKNIFCYNAEGNIQSFNLETGNSERIYSLETPVRSSYPKPFFALSPDGKILYVVERNSVINFYDVETKELTAKLFNFADENWVLVDKNNRYDGTLNGLANMFLNSNGKLSALSSNSGYTRTANLFGKISANVKNPVTVAAQKPPVAVEVPKTDSTQKSEADQRFKEAKEFIRSSLSNANSVRIERAKTLITEDRNYVAARKWIEYAISETEESLGKEDTILIEPLQMLMGIEVAQGKINSAEGFLRRAIAISEKSGVKTVSDFEQRFELYILLATLHTLRGDLWEAENIYRNLLEILNKKESKPLLYQMLPKLVEILSKYIEILEFMGEEEKLADTKLNLFEALSKLKPSNSADKTEADGMKMMEEVFPQISLLMYSGNLDEIEKIYEKTVAAQEKLNGAESLEVMQTLFTLGRVYAAKGKYDKAEETLNRARNIFGKVLPDDSPFLASLDLQLGFLALLKNDLAKTEEISRRVLQIYAKSELGEYHPDASSIHWLLGLCYQFQGKFAEAEKEFQRASFVGQIGFGSRNQNTLMVKTSQAALAQIRGDYPQALKLQIENNKITEEKLTEALTVKGEIFKQKGLSDFGRQLDNTISLQRNAGNNQEITNLAFASVLQRKGRSLDAMANVYKNIRRRLSPDNQKILDELSAKQTQLAALVIKSSGQTISEELTQTVKNLELQISRLEGELISRSKEFRAQVQPVTPAVVRENLPEKSALVEFAVYRPLNKNAKSFFEMYESPRYMAYLLTKNGDVKAVDLGMTVEIDKLAAEFRNLVGSSSSGLAQTKEAGRKLDSAVMQPLRNLMTERPEHIFVSPDGNLNLVPFSALVDEQDQYLVENFLITYLTNGRELAQLSREKVQLTEPVIIANPNYDWQENAVQTERKTVEIPTEKRSGNYKNLRFDPLKGTMEEAAAMGVIYPKAKMLTDDAATEKSLKALKTPYFLHIATHGFFLSSKTEQADEISSLFSILPNSQVAGFGEENPLLRSGIVLAGANNFQVNKDEDGVLTALEIAALDLTGTKLVVLSACETAVGDIETGEGVYGLRRSLVIAGSESQVISLWKVSDAATRDLMIDFYKNLQIQLGRGDSLRQAQLKMLNQKNAAQTDNKRDRSKIYGVGESSTDRGQGFEHPFFWSSFIQAGEWRKLDETNLAK